MPRFFRNRLWTFILALSFSLGIAAVTHAPADCSSGAPVVSDDPNSGGGLGGGTSYGDPDAPSGDSKRSVLRGVSLPGGGSTIAGDDLELRSAWMWRLRIALQSLRGIWIHP